MGDFKWRQFSGEVILHGVRWYCKYGISYRELEEMMEERGIEVDHTTIYRWVQRYAPLMEKRLRWHRRWCNYTDSWRVDETYIKVKGQWRYLYRAVDSEGRSIDFYLSQRRNMIAATIFLRKAVRAMRRHQPKTVTTDECPHYGLAVRAINAGRKRSQQIEHRKHKYLNNVVECDHGKLKRLIKPMLGFKSMPTARATLKGLELMRMFRKGQFDFWIHGQGVAGEVRLIRNCFGL